MENIDPSKYIAQRTKWILTFALKQSVFIYPNYLTNIINIFEYSMMCNIYFLP